MEVQLVSGSTLASQLTHCSAYEQQLESRCVVYGQDDEQVESVFIGMLSCSHAHFIR